MPAVEAATVLHKVGMMVGSKPGWVIHVAVTVSLTAAGPLVPRGQPVLLVAGRLLVLPSLCVGRLRPGRPLLMLR